MKAEQHGDPPSLATSVHRCFAVYRPGFFLVIGLSASVFLWLTPFSRGEENPVADAGETVEKKEEKAGRGIEDFAQVYVDEYHEPDESLLLSGKGRDKSLALAHFWRARSLEGRGQIESAADAYREVLRLAPGEHALARKTAYLLAQSGRHGQALRLLEDNLERNAGEARAHIALSEYLATYHSHSIEERERALAVAEEAAERFPGEAAVHDHLVKMYLVANRRDDARAVVEKAMESQQRDPRFWLHLGRIAVQLWRQPGAGEPEEGSEEGQGDGSGERQEFLPDRIFAKALEHAEGDAAVREIVADYHHGRKQFAEAEKLYRGIVEEEPDRLDVRRKLARVYAGLQDEEKIIETLQGIVRIDPLDAAIHRELGTIYSKRETDPQNQRKLLHREDAEAAAEHFRQALRIDRGEERDYSLLAEFLVVNELDGQLLGMAEEAAALYPESPDFPWWNTFAHARAERWEEALEEFAKAETLAEKHKPERLEQFFYYRYGVIAEQSGDLDLAGKLLQKSIELITRNDPDGNNKEFAALVYNYLGYTWLDADRNIEEAGELIKTAAEFDPDSGAIADSLGWYYFKTGRFEEAKEELFRAEVQTEKPDAVIYDHIGQVLFELGDKEQAVEYMEKAVEMEPEEEEFSERLAEYREAAKAGADAAKASGDGERDKTAIEESEEAEIEEEEAEETEADKFEKVEVEDALDMPALEEDIETLKKAVHKDPEDAAAHHALAKLYLEREKDPDNSEKLLNREDAESAARHMRQTLHLDRANEDAHAMLARFLVVNELDEELLEFTKDASEQFPESPEFPWWNTFAHVRAERWEEALEEFAKAEDLAEKHKPERLEQFFYYHYGVAAEQSGDLGLAGKLLQKSIEHIAHNDPDGKNKKFAARVYNYLGYIWLDADRNIEEAGELIKTAAEYDPTSGAIADSLGWYYFKTGRAEEAKEELFRAELQTEKPDAVIYDHIGRVLHSLGETEQAVEYMEKAVEMGPEEEEFSERLAEYHEAAKAGRNAESAKGREKEKAEGAGKSGLELEGDAASAPEKPEPGE